MIAYVARELHTGRTLSADGDTQLPAYSTIKVLLGAAFRRIVARGELDEAQRYRFEPGSCAGGSGVLRGMRHAVTLCLADVVHLALVVSDNDAANAIAGAVGLERVKALAGELGMTRTCMRRVMMDQPPTWHFSSKSSPSAGASNRSSATASSPHRSCRSTSTASPATCRPRRGTRASAATTSPPAGTRTTARSSPWAIDGRRSS
jgi:beta-lactamase class A